MEKFYKALAGLALVEDQAERNRIALQSWNSIGNLFRSMRRYVEAALAFHQGLEVAKTTKDQAEIERQGVAWYNTLLSRQRETKSRRDSKAKDNAMHELSQLGMEDKRSDWKECELFR